MMAISTETESLIKLYNQKIELDNKQLSQVNLVQAGYNIVTGVGSTDQIKIWGPTEVIDTYNVPIKNIDERIVEINDEIKVLQNQVLILGQGANSVGCGTTAWSLGFTTVTVYEDVLKYEGYSFSGNNPFNTIQGNLTTGNLGIGTYGYITPVSIGTYYGSISTCSGGILSPCFLDPQLCPGFAASITALSSQIVTLQSERDDLLDKVNFLRSGRIDAELQNYAYNQSKVRLNQSIAISNSILSFLQDPANDEFL